MGRVLSIVRLSFGTIVTLSSLSLIKIARKETRDVEIESLSGNV